MVPRGGDAQSRHMERVKNNVLRAYWQGVCIPPQWWVTWSLIWAVIEQIDFDINHSKILFDSSPRVMEIKTKINKWDLIKINSFCTTKETIKMKIQPSERGEIFVFNPNHTEKFKADI